MVPGQNRLEQIQQFVVTAEQMRAIEGRVFAAGMPVAALMEKVAGLITRRVQALYPLSSHQKVGVLVGPGHNGGDALVVARELHLQGYAVVVYRPFSKLKELTQQHAQYAESLGIALVDQIEALQSCDWLIDGLFGFGLERSLSDSIAEVVNQINQWSVPVVSIDLPSGLHTDTGAVLGTAIRATQTLCLGLWKLGLLQDNALEYVGTAELIDFGLPLANIEAVLTNSPRIHRITPQTAIANLPLPRSATSHKYKMGHLLAICGSRRYTGGAILTALGARASGVGMLSVAVPESIKPLLSAQLPEALIIDCPETSSGAIAQLPESVELNSYNAIACGPGLTMDASAVVERVIASDRPLVLDADALNVLAQAGTIPTLTQRQAPTVLTPHLGEFKRLFPAIAEEMTNRAIAVREAAQQTGAVVLLKGARVAIANPTGTVWINPASTPALARGGSGDVLTGLIGGLLAQDVLQSAPVEAAVQTGVWWHAEAGILAAQERTELGVDAFTLTQYLMPALRSHLH
ncbi:NAD(P)H-hydrate dehydratase [Trichocoleus desertorum]|uniref:NAD(P)H-hydrate dehydratase n=1 Tax=Trichocoleus desertorum TaxID=1481672 RepID=UPI003298C08D